MLRPPYAASRTAPVRAVVLMQAERFENFRNRAIHASPIAFSMPARSSDDTIVSATVMLRNKAPSASETPRRINSPAMVRLRVSRSAIFAQSCRTTGLLLTRVVERYVGYELFAPGKSIKSAVMQQNLYSGELLRSCVLSRR